MSDVFESIERGLLEALEHAKGNETEGRLHHVNVSDDKDGMREEYDLSDSIKNPYVNRELASTINVREIRQNVGMTQTEFAQTFGFSVGTLRYWENGLRAPTGSALVLLNVMAKEPEAVLRALSIAV